MNKEEKRQIVQDFRQCSKKVEQGCFLNSPQNGRTPNWMNICTNEAIKVCRQTAQNKYLDQYHK